MKITIRRDANTFGPYTVEQVQAMVRDRVASPMDVACCEGSDEWKPLYSIAGLTLPTEPKPNPVPQNDAFLKTIELQQKMKSMAVAVLLGVFVPFFGVLYSAPVAAFVCGGGGICALLLFMSGAEGDPDFANIVITVSLLVFSIFYIISIFRAIAGVKRYNENVIKEYRYTHSEEG
jgi:hypothetical protein